jgi:hypothetical protein
MTVLLINFNYIHLFSPQILWERGNLRARLGVSFSCIVFYYFFIIFKITNIENENLFFEIMFEWFKNFEKKIKKKIE